MFSGEPAYEATWTLGDGTSCRFAELKMGPNPNRVSYIVLCVVYVSGKGEG